jgi:hypothetical protein
VLSDPQRSHFGFFIRSAANSTTLRDISSEGAAR